MVLGTRPKWILKTLKNALSAVTAGNLVLSTAEIEFLQDVVRFRKDEIAKYDALITDIEQVEANVDDRGGVPDRQGRPRGSIEYSDQRNIEPSTEKSRCSECVD